MSAVIRIVLSGLLAATCAAGSHQSPAADEAQSPFQTSDRCVACHNGLTDPAGHDISIGLDWRTSLMANSARDPYWQASIRREAIDHPRAVAEIEDECSSCHMPMARYHSKSMGERGRVFVHLAASPSTQHTREALDGVSCSLCHQLSEEKLGAPETFSGQFVIASTPAGSPRPEFGPFDIDAGLKRIMQSSSRGFVPTRADHIRKSELCASCHTLHTKALGDDGEVVGTLPEQTPYQEWLHSRYVDEQSCQSCHMPAVAGPAAISRVLGEPREGMARHLFVGGNFFIQRMLGRYRDDLGAVALPQELSAAATRTLEFLHARAARISVTEASLAGRDLRMKVHVENLGGHKLPTAYPSRRVWLHLTVTDADGCKVFESGALNADGSIVGNDNDRDPAAFERHYRVIRSADEVQIYESVLADRRGGVTTGLLKAVSYVKDNRLLPHGFSKATASSEIAVRGDAAADAGFDDRGHTVEFAIDASRARAPLRVQAELLYQPIGFRWARNLDAYDAPETKRFVSYFDSMRGGTAAVLATVELQLGRGQSDVSHP